MPETPEHPDDARDDADESPDVEFLTVNQLVAYNLMRARRKKGWTQQEAALHLLNMTGRRWTAATLSASERSWQTGRSRDFDANELAAFSAVFDQPISYFFLPIQPKGDIDVKYILTKTKDSALMALDMRQLLDLAVPIRWSPTMVDQVNSLLRSVDLTWSPSARVDWYRPEEMVDYDVDYEGIDLAPDPPDPTGDNVYVSFALNAQTGNEQMVVEISPEEPFAVLAQALKALTARLKPYAGTDGGRELPLHQNAKEDE